MTNVLPIARTGMSIGGIIICNDTNVMVYFKPGEYVRKMCEYATYRHFSPSSTQDFSFET